MEDTPECEKKDDIEKFEERSPAESMPVPVDSSPAALMQIALSKNMDLDKLEKMLELQTKYEERKAKKAFVKAMATFKANPPDIYKDKINLQFDSMYTSLSGLVNKTIPELSKHGFSHNWNYGTAENGNPEVTCVLTHELGHSISVTQDAAPIQSKNKAGQIVTNPIQQTKCTQTYLKITTFEAVTGLVSKEANLDDDGNAVGSKISLLEQWTIKCDEAGNNAKSVDEIAAWWKQNSSVIKKELSKADAAKIYAKTNDYNKKLRIPEREPGSDG